ncbi:MAG: cupin domain-containing protein [Thermoanaerobaculia bacterium]|nr:MAG: cupin domain-containing protein [Thermoanaerobaculia bacterium]
MGHRVHELVRGLALAPHPEGGWYREVFRAGRPVDPLDGRPRRSALTAIYFLLAAGQHGRWHRVESDEVWTWIEGGPLRLHLFEPATGRATAALVGPVGEACEPVRVTPAGVWQAAEPVEEYALVSCAVGPGFDFADFRFLESDSDARARLAAARPDLLRLN